MIETVDEIIAKRGKHWSVVTDDPVLRDFLAPHGDYEFLFRFPGELDKASGGNAIDWTVRGDSVELRHQHAPDLPPCTVRRDVLEKVVGRLAEDRHVTPSSAFVARHSAETNVARKVEPRKRATKR